MIGRRLMTTAFLVGPVLGTALAAAIVTGCTVETERSTCPRSWLASFGAAQRACRPHLLKQ